MSHTHEVISRTAAIHVCGMLVVIGLGVATYVLGVQPDARAKERAALLSQQLIELSGEESDLRRRQREGEARLREAAVRLEESGIELRPTSMLNEQVSEITTLAAETGFRVDSISPSTPQQDEDFVRVPVRITGSATSSDVVRLMRECRVRFSDLTVRTFDLRSDIASVSPTMTVQMELVWHALRPDR